MNGGTISGNEAKKGAGVFMLGGKFDMKDGLITDNEAIFIGSDIDSVGAGVVVAGGATFNMTGGVIADNESEGDGGGIHISGGTLNVSDNALITENTAKRAGGGINISGGIVNISGGDITKNKGVNGGGIFISNGANPSTLNITGGTIGGDTANANIATDNGNGGGVAFYAPTGAGIGTFTVGGTAVIRNNINEVTGMASNIHLDEGRFITLNTPITTIDIRVTKTLDGGVIVESITGTGITASNVTQYIKSDFDDRVPMLWDNKIALTILIDTPAKLQRVGGGVDDGWTRSAHYLQTAPIALTGVWSPLATYVLPFIGRYNGDGFTITGLNITSGGDIGLFRAIGAGSRVENLGLVDVLINASGMYAGGIAAVNLGGTISNCYVTGTINSTSSDVGGIAGANQNGGIIEYCYATCSVSGISNVGGIIGNNDVGRVENSIALNSIITRTGTGAYTTFGRIAGNSNANLNNNYAWNGMTVSGSIVTTGTGVGTVHGADLTQEQIKAQPIWQNNFPDGAGFAFGTGTDEALPWRWEPGKMPRLYSETTLRDWPEHLNKESTGSLNITFNPVNHAPQLENITLYRTSVNPQTEPTQINLTATGSHTNPEWWLNNQRLSNTNTLTLRALDYTPGTRFITLEVMVDSKPYSRTITFTVVE